MDWSEPYGRVRQAGSVARTQKPGHLLPTGLASALACRVGRLRDLISPPRGGKSACPHARRLHELGKSGRRCAQAIIPSQPLAYSAWIVTGGARVPQVSAAGAARPRFACPPAVRSSAVTLPRRQLRHAAKSSGILGPANGL